MKVNLARSYKDHPVYGQTIRRQEVSGLVLSESAYRPGLRIPRHVHERDGYFCLVLQGGYTERTGHAERELEPATLSYHPPGETHSDRFYDTRTKLFCVWFSSGWLDGIRGHAEVLNQPTVYSRGSTVRLASKLYQEFRQMDEVSSLMIEGLVLEMLAETFRASGSNCKPTAPPWLGQVEDLLQARFNETITISNIAESAGVHPIHLTRVFRRYFGCTVGEYARRLRVEFACRELSSSQSTLVEIASAAGFCDQAHFSRTFKRLTGLTPRQYRSAFGPC